MRSQQSRVIAAKHENHTSTWGVDLKVTLREKKKPESICALRLLFAAKWCYFLTIGLKVH